MVADPMVPENDISRNPNISGVAIPQHVADWAMIIYRSIQADGRYVGGEHLGAHMAGQPGWLVAYTARNPTQPVAFAHIDAGKERHDCTFDQFGVIAQSLEQHRQAAAALMYCALMGRSDGRVFLRVPLGQQTQKLVANWGFSEIKNKGGQSHWNVVSSIGMLACLVRLDPFVQQLSTRAG